jgi:hypothetical protein
VNLNFHEHVPVYAWVCLEPSLLSVPQRNELLASDCFKVWLQLRLSMGVADLAELAIR